MVKRARQGLDGKTLRRCAAVLLLALLAGCASVSQTSLQANVAAPDKKNGDGIGGTGISTALINPRGDGIGGTGIRGTITGFGSILVNGLKLDFDHTTTVVTDGKPVSLEALRVGQIIQGVAHSKNGKLSLATLEIQHAVSGPITAIDHATETLAVLGQNVRLNLAGDKAAIAAFATLQASDIVSVSGLRQADGLIVATRIDQRSDDERILLRGTATAATATTVSIGALEIPAVPGAPLPKAGEQVFAAGRMINGAFVPDVVMGYGPLVFGSDVTAVSLEAHAPRAAGSPEPLVIDGVKVSGAALPAGTALNDRIVVTGQIAGPDSVTATNIDGIRTVVTINAAEGSLRPAAIRPDTTRSERVAPRPNVERPRAVRPEPPARQRPAIERPTEVPMV